MQKRSREAIPAAQTRRCLEIIQSAIAGLGGKLSDVIRTRVLLTRIEDWEQVAAVHGEFFGDIRPANTIMQVVRFIDPDWLVEIEALTYSDSGWTLICFT
jgi:enamine deaminase RidA (YjgF/YER057c/UK114 family)